MRDKVAVIAAHPDDEVLGCGGTIARHVQAGDEVHVLIMAEGVTSRDIKRDREHRSSELSDLAKAANRANEILGVKSLTLNDYPDNRMDSVALIDIVKSVESFIAKHRPAIIYTHHAGDLNIDHRRIHEAVVTATRPLPGSHIRSLLFFEVVSSTEWSTPHSLPSFLPDWFVDISNTLEAKLRAMRVYESELRAWPHPRSIEALEHLARWRGATVGRNAAEAFVLGRNIIS